MNFECAISCEAESDFIKNVAKWATHFATLFVPMVCVVPWYSRVSVQTARRPLSRLVKIIRATCQISKSKLLTGAQLGTIFNRPCLLPRSCLAIRLLFTEIMTAYPRAFTPPIGLFSPQTALYWHIQLLFQCTVQNNRIKVSSHIL